MSTAYESVHPMIHRIIRTVDYLGLPEDEAISAAGLGYAKAAATYDTSRGAFTTWVWHHVVTELRNTAKQIRRWSRPIPAATGMPTTGDVAVDHGDFLDDLTDDAMAVVRLVIDPPAGIEGRPVKCKLRHYLRGVGWTAGRIAESFAEIRRVLQ